MFFEAYPIIFQGIYKLSTGIAGLAYLFSKLPSKTTEENTVLRSYSRRRWSRWFHCIPILRLFPATGKSPQSSLGIDRRISETTPCLYRWATLCPITFLAWLDIVSECSLDCADARWHSLRVGIFLHLQCSPKLRYGCLQDLIR